MLRSFSFYPKEVPLQQWAEVYEAVKKWKPLIIKENGIQQADEVMHKIIYHVITHQYENIDGYVSSLAKHIGRDNNRREIGIDFGESVIAESDNDSVIGTEFNMGTTKDFTSDLIHDLDRERDGINPIIEMILLYPTDFYNLCRRLYEGSLTKYTGSQEFKKYYMNLYNEYEDLLTICKSLYSKLSDAFAIFESPSTTPLVPSNWDYIFENTLKGITLVGEDETTEVDDADLEEFYIRGLRKGYHIYRINYSSIMDDVENLYDSDTSNVAKLIIEDNYLLKYLDGSVSIPNCDVYAMLEDIRECLMTNILKNYKTTRYLHMGTENFYVLSKCELNIEWCVTIFSTNYTLKGEDITSKVIRIDD